MERASGTLPASGRLAGARLAGGMRAFARLAAALALLFMMGLTTVDVIGRKFLGHSVHGSLELTELAMLVLIFAALPVATLAGQQIFFDLFDSWLPRRAGRWQRVVGHLLSAGFLAAAAWFVLGKAGNTKAMGDITAQLAIPVAPFQYAAAVLVCATALAHLWLAWRDGRNEGDGRADKADSDGRDGGGGRDGEAAAATGHDEQPSSSAL